MRNTRNLASGRSDGWTASTKSDSPTDQTVTGSVSPGVDDTCTHVNLVLPRGRSSEWRDDRAAVAETPVRLRVGGAARAAHPSIQLATNVGCNGTTHPHGADGERELRGGRGQLRDAFPHLAARCELIGQHHRPH